MNKNDDYLKYFNLKIEDKRLHKELRLLAVKKDMTLQELMIHALKTYVKLGEKERNQIDLLTENEEK